jgi:hypothetical protein
MEASPLNFGCVADVVQVRCSNQVAAILLVKDHAYLASALANSPDVIPSSSEWREQAFSLSSGPLFEHHHRWTIPRTGVPDLSDRCFALRLRQ